jgi:MinD superfamily P-loop ATPase
MNIAIASGKGGTGKTFISTNLFNVLQKRGLHIALVDCDAEEPNDREFFPGGVPESSRQVTQQVPVIDESRCTYCGKCAAYCNYNAIFFLEERRVIRAMDELCHGCGACSVACSYGAISEKEDLLGFVNRYTFSEKSALIEARMKVGVHSSVRLIKAAIKEAEGFDLTLSDAPPGTACPFIQTVAMADYVVLVTEPTPFGVSDLHQSVETLRGMDKSFGVIVNRAGLGNNDIYAYLQQQHIPLIMRIPFDREIAVSYSNGALVTELCPDWAEQFNQLYHIIQEQYGNCHHQW